MLGIRQVVIIIISPLVLPSTTTLYSLVKAGVMACKGQVTWVDCLGSEYEFNSVSYSVPRPRVGRMGRLFGRNPRPSPPTAQRKAAAMSERTRHPASEATIAMEGVAGRQNQQTSSRGGGFKRQRAAQACDTCRSMKSKVRHATSAFGLSHP